VLDVASVVSRLDDSGSDVAAIPQVALPPPGTSNIRLQITQVSNSIMRLCVILLWRSCALISAAFN